MKDIILRAEDVGLCVQDLWVLRHVSMSLRMGEFFVIMGPNGCGKTTLLKILAGLVQPTEGRVRLCSGESFHVDMPEAIEQRSVESAFVFDEGGLISNLSIFDNIALPLRYRGLMSEIHIRERVEEVVAEYSLAGYARMRPVQLTPSLRKRAQIARVKVIQPHVVFYDNPQQGLDPDQRKLVREGIWALHKESVRLSIIGAMISEWELDATERVGILREGTLEAVGTVQELSAHPVGRIRELFPSR